MEVPEELEGKFKFARQKSKLAGTIRGSFFVIKKIILMRWEPMNKMTSVETTMKVNARPVGKMVTYWTVTSLAAIMLSGIGQLMQFEETSSW